MHQDNAGSSISPSSRSLSRGSFRAPLFSPSRRTRIREVRSLDLSERPQEVRAELFALLERLAAQCPEDYPGNTAAWVAAREALRVCAERGEDARGPRQPGVPVVTVVGGFEYLCAEQVSEHVGLESLCRVYVLELAVDRLPPARLLLSPLAGAPGDGSGHDGSGRDVSAQLVSLRSLRVHSGRLPRFKLPVEPLSWSHSSGRSYDWMPLSTLLSFKLSQLRALDAFDDPAQARAAELGATRRLLGRLLPLALEDQLGGFNEDGDDRSMLRAYAQWAGAEGFAHFRPLWGGRLAEPEFAALFMAQARAALHHEVSPQPFGPEWLGFVTVPGEPSPIGARLSAVQFSHGADVERLELHLGGRQGVSVNLDLFTLYPGQQARRWLSTIVAALGDFPQA